MTLVWQRAGQWAAHLYIDGETSCPYPGSYVRQAVPAAMKGKPPQPAPIGPHGIPYGRVCVRCLKAWHERNQRVEAMRLAAAVKVTAAKVLSEVSRGRPTR